MNEAGMTDLQFKSFLKLIINSLESVRNQKTKAGMDEKLNELILDFQKVCADDVR